MSCGEGDKHSGPGLRHNYFRAVVVLPSMAHLARVSAFSFALVAVLLSGACRQNPADGRQLGAISGATAEGTTATSAQRPEGWDAYWYAGLAELNKYTTIQNRYGEDRPGTAVLVWVTEPFLPEQQVKDDGDGGDEAFMSVLKLNRIERFTTGIYDYSIMQSVFTPVSRDQYPHTLKTTISVQDWCGQVWSQYNLRKGDYRVEHRSYFQREADTEETLDAVLLEDELPTLVRLDPSLVPTGRIRAIPSEKFARLFHIPTEVHDATVEMTRETAAGTIDVTLDFPKLEREIAYQFAADFPHRLLRWRETHKGQRLMEAELDQTLQEPYWQQNKNAFAPMRDSLGL